MFKAATLKIPVRSLSKSELSSLKETLTLPNQQYLSILKHSKWAPSKDIPEHLFYYHEDLDYITVPRNYPCDLDVEDLTVKGLKASMTFIGSLRDYQEDFMDLLDPEETDQLWEVPCGHGKTVMALYKAAQINRKTFVLVDTQYLAQQWSDRIESYLGIKVYQLQRSALSALSIHNIISNNDIFICTLDMFNSILSYWSGVEAMDVFLKESIGTLILDEAHRMGADSYHPIINLIPAKYRIALTATFRRGDGTHKILKLHFGKQFTMKSVFPPAELRPLFTDVFIEQLVPKFRELGKGKDKKLVNNLPDNFSETLNKFKIPFDETDTYYHFPTRFKKADCDFFVAKRLLDRKQTKYLLEQKPVSSAMDTYVIQHSGRMKKVTLAIDKCLKAGRCILVLSKRKEVLKTLHAAYSARGIKSTLIVSETNKMTAEQRKEMENTSQIVFGITQIAQQGFDMDRLDTLIMLHPIIDTEQPIGRTCRLLPGKKYSLVLWVFDNAPTYLSMYKKSHKFVEINAVIKKGVTVKQLDEIL